MLYLGFLDIANKVALLAHFVVDPDAKAILEDVCTPAPKPAKIVAQADGNTPMDLRYQKLNLAASSANVNARKYVNIFDEEVWPELKDFDPSLGKFKDGKEFAELWTRMKNQYDTLLSDLNQSGRNESGEVLDKTALEFCKQRGHGRVLNLPLFYCYLVWKNKNLTFTSNALPEGIAMSSGLPSVAQKRDSSETSGDVASTGASKKRRQSKDEKAATYAAEALGKVFVPLLQSSSVHSDPELYKEKLQSEISSNNARTIYMEKQNKIEESKARAEKLLNLSQSPIFKQLSKEQQDTIINDLVKESCT
jgi:hypothetical protein